MNHPPECLSPIYLFLASHLSKRRYYGKIINQQIIFEIIHMIRTTFSGQKYNLNEIMSAMKQKLTKSMYSVMRKNQELIDFIINRRYLT